MAVIDHERLLTEISDFIVSQIDDERVQGLSYRGILPAINTREDFVHFPNSLFPFVGVAPIGVNYLDNSLGQYFPGYDIQVIYSSRESGIDPPAMIRDMLHFTQQIETILVDTIRGNRFGLQETILAAELLDLNMLPTFYTAVDKNRKAYSIAFFTVKLYLGGL